MKDLKQIMRTFVLISCIGAADLPGQSTGAGADSAPSRSVGSGFFPPTVAKTVLRRLSDDDEARIRRFSAPLSELIKATVCNVIIMGASDGTRYADSNLQACYRGDLTEQLRANLTEEVREVNIHCGLSMTGHEHEVLQLFLDTSTDYVTTYNTIVYKMLRPILTELHAFGFRFVPVSRAQKVRNALYAQRANDNPLDHLADWQSFAIGARDDPCGYPSYRSGVILVRLQRA